jgi:Peptidase family M28
VKAAQAIIIALIIGVFLGIYTTTPPSPRGTDAPLTEFSAGRAMADIRAISAKPHETGSAENAEVRSHIFSRMTALGMETQTDRAALPPEALKYLNSWSGRNDSAITLTNIIGILPGRDRTLPAVMLMSHHDTVWGSPGAADDTTGVAASLEVARAIKARGMAERDLVLLMTDAEEIGLNGAKHFFANNPLRTRIGAIINLEARGGGGRANMFQTSRDNGAAMQLYAAHVRQPATSSLSAFIYSVLPNDTDLTPALKGDYTAYNLAFIGRSGLYHSPLITPDRLDQGSVQDIGDQTLDLSTALLVRSGIPPKAADIVFFDWLGLVTVHYPVWLGWVLLGAALAAFVWAVHRDGARGMGAGAFRFVAVAAVAGLLVYAFNWVSVGGGQGEYYDRLAAIPRLEAGVALACLAAFAALIGPWKATTGSVAGFAFPLMLMAAAGQFFAPTAIYFVTLPLLLVGVTIAMPAGTPRSLVGAAAFAAIVGYIVALGHFVMQGVGPMMPLAALLPFVLGVLAVLPLWQPLAQRIARITAAVAAMLALGIALWVLLDAPADTVAVYATAA